MWPSSSGLREVAAISRPLVWPLRICLAIQCFGVGAIALQYGSPINSLLFDQQQTGGLDLSEQTAESIDRLGGYGLLVAGLCILVRPCWPVLVSVAVWQLLIASAAVQIGGKPMSQYGLLGQSLQYIAPLALALLLPSARRASLPAVRINTAVWMLRIATAGVFTAHGIEAISLHPEFVDYLIRAAEQLLGEQITQPTAETLLRVIGVIDIALALTLLADRWWPIAAYMALWGIVTAMSRVVASGWGNWPEAAMRAGNAGVPLALSVYWYVKSRNTAKINTATSNLKATKLMSVDFHSNRHAGFVRRMCMAILAVVWCLGAVVICRGAEARKVTQLEGTHPAQWRLIWSSKPATEAILSWNTQLAGTRHLVRIAKGKQGAEKIVPCDRNGQYTSGTSTVELYYHHVRLTDLEPATKYYVTFESDAERSPTFHFITASDKDRPLSILFGGDSRSDRSARRNVNTMISTLFQKGMELAALGIPSEEIIALAHGGDYVAKGKNLDQWSRWMSDYELTTSASGRLLPIIPARGNHDGGPIFNEVFAFPVDHLNYYGIDLCATVHLVTLNSETSMGGNQARWLAKQLALARPKRRWLLAQYHRPAFPAFKKASSALQHCVPLFDRYAVDMVLEADGHTIKRTVPIRDGKQNEAGTVYVGEGGLGVKPRTPKTDRWYLRFPGKVSSGHHVQKLTFSPNKLRMRVILLDNEKVFDDYSRSPRGR